MGLPGIYAGDSIDANGNVVKVYTNTKYSLLVETVDGRKFLLWLPKHVSWLCELE